MTTTTDYSKIAVIDCGSSETRTGEGAIPLFMRDDGEEISKKRGKELECFLKCLETFPLNTVILGEKTLIFHDGGEEGRPWFQNSTTKEELLDFLLNPKNHKVNGKIWNNGFLGSRWADTKLNGKQVRLAFYTKKSDPGMFASFPSRKEDYAIVVCMQ